MKQIKCLTLAVAVMVQILVSAEELLAQEKSAISSTSSKKARSVKIKFDDEMVNGSATTPDMNSINAKNELYYKKLIRVRENFIKEMEDGLND